MRYDLILWDFDGTLVDTAPGIMESICYTCKQLEYKEPNEKTLRNFIGPSLYYSFQTFLGFEAPLAEKATHLFREHYLNGSMYNCEIYPGLPALLKKLIANGVQNAVTTLKPENTANLLLNHFEIADCFALCKGSDHTKMQDLTKAQTVEHVLEKLSVSKNRAVLIGDTALDEEGAKNSGIDFIAAAYGQEFNQKPQCVFYAKTVSDLENFLL